MARVALIASFIVFAAGSNPNTKTCDASTEESCLFQQKHTAEVKTHYGTQRCSHLDAAIQKQAAKKKVDCMGGRDNGEPYCAPGSEVTCPGSNATCGTSIGKPCCPNPCIGIEPYGDAKTFPCPSNRKEDPNPGDACEAKDKVEDCLDPCATPEPTPSPTPATDPTPSPTPATDPTPSPTPATAPTPGPTLWVCHESDLLNPPMYKATPNMACSTHSTCYGDDISDCETQATCYAKKTIDTCSSKARCCAGQEIDTCEAGATCYAKHIIHCSTKATCIERPKWNVGDD